MQQVRGLAPPVSAKTGKKKVRRIRTICEFSELFFDIDSLPPGGSKALPYDASFTA